MRSTACSGFTTSAVRDNLLEIDGIKGEVGSVANSIMQLSDVKLRNVITLFQFLILFV